MYEASIILTVWYQFSNNGCYRQEIFTDAFLMKAKKYFIGLIVQKKSFNWNNIYLIYIRIYRLFDFKMIVKENNRLWKWLLNLVSKIMSKFFRDETNLLVIPIILWKHYCIIANFERGFPLSVKYTSFNLYTWSLWMLTLTSRP